MKYILISALVLCSIGISHREEPKLRRCGTLKVEHDAFFVDTPGFLQLEGWDHPEGGVAPEVWRDVGIQQRVWSAAYGLGEKTLVVALEERRTIAHVFAKLNTSVGCRQMHLGDGSRLSLSENGTIHFRLKLVPDGIPSTVMWSGSIALPDDED